MKCQNCQAEMELFPLCDDAGEVTTIYWCGDCGSVFKQNSLGLFWRFPKSVENTKKLVKELIKAKDRNNGVIERLNKMERDNWEFMDLGEDDRK